MLIYDKNQHNTVKQLAHSLPPGEDGRVEPYVDFAEFYRLWSVDHGEQSVVTAP